MTRLSLAIPSKGRLKEKSEAWLASAGFPVTQIGGERGYGDLLERLVEAGDRGLRGVADSEPLETRAGDFTYALAVAPSPRCTREASGGAQGRVLDRWQ